MTKKDLIISFLLLTFSITGYSQNDWRQGYIIENSGDTIYGLIDYRSPKSNSQYCYFRESEQVEIIKYSPKQIKGYRYVNGKYYVSKSIKINEIESIVFLEFLINGMANIYYFKNEDEKYYIEKNNQIYELKNSEKQINSESINYIKEQKEYIGLMSYLFQEAQIAGDINNTELEHNSLIKIAKKYHNKVCTDEECVIYEKKINPIKIDFGLVYGKYNKTLQLTENLYYNLDNNLSNYFGLAINIRNIPDIYERFSLHMELLASEYYLGTKQRYQLNVPLLLDYKILSKRFYPKVELGTSMYFINNDQVTTQHMTFIAGLSLHYEFYKDYRIFINTRIEKNPRIVRFGGGLIF